MQKKKLIVISVLAILLLSSALSFAAAQETPSIAKQSEDTQDNTVQAMAIGFIAAVITVGLIGVLFFRKQN